MLLLCSDGLWNYRPEAAELAAMAMPAALTRPLDAAADLAKFALDSGGLDNITVVIIPFPPRPDAVPPTVATAAHHRIRPVFRGIRAGCPLTRRCRSSRAADSRPRRPRPARHRALPSLPSPAPRPPPGHGRSGRNTTPFGRMHRGPSLPRAAAVSWRAPSH